MMMPSSGLTLGNSCGRRNALLLLWLYIRTAWMKLKPTSGALIRTIDHSARLTSSSRLVQIETVKWLVQRQEWLGRHQRQRDQQALHIALRERIDALAQHGLQGQLVEDDALPAPGLHVVHATEEREHFDRVQLGVWRHVVRQIEHDALRVPVRRRLVADVERASRARPQTRQTLHQGGL